jgi:uncharacterized protein (UPF0218 family)
MKTAYAVTPQLRIKLKEPFGTLILGTPEQTIKQLKCLLEAEQPPMLISVGDVVSRNLHLYRLHPQVSIIDHVSLRDQPTEAPKRHGEKTRHVANPQGVITEEAIEAVKESIDEGGHIHIVVEGEEDLLTLVAVRYAPQNGFVVYGQPHCGIVAVKATAAKKAEVEEFLKEMKPTKS